MSELRPCAPFSDFARPYFTYQGHSCVDVPPSDHNLVAAIRLREFNGTAHNGRFSSLPLFNPFSHQECVDAGEFTLSNYLSVAGRGNESEWVRAHVEGCKEVEDDSLGNLTMFVKVESYPGKQPHEIKPRIIKACSAAYAARFNPFCYAIGQHWKLHCRRDRMPAFGMTGDDVGDWLAEVLGEYTSPVFIENDCSAWDSCVSVDALRYEGRFYESRFRLPASWHALFRMQYRQVCKNRSGSVRFSREGGRASGVGNTSIGNTYLNLAMHDHLATVRCHIIALGDDMLCVTEMEDAPKLCSAFEDGLSAFGFQPKAKWTAVLEQAEFCSSYLARSECGRYCLVPKTGKQLFKLLRARDRSHAAAVATGVLTGSPDPLLRLIMLKIKDANMLPCTGLVDLSNPYSLKWGKRLATMESVRARYGPVIGHVPTLVGDFFIGDNPDLDLIMEVDFPGVAGDTLAAPFPTMTKKVKHTTRATPDVSVEPFYEGQVNLDLLEYVQPHSLEHV